MASTIKLKNGSGAPTAGDLVQGEPALDLTNKRLYTEDSGGTVLEIGTNPTSLTTGTFTSTGIDDNATSTAITIDSNENVGIGTTSPQGPLHVYGSEYAYFASNVAGVTPDSATGGIAIGWNKSSGLGESIIAYNKGGGAAGGLVFANNDGGTYNERLRIDSSGRLLINKTSSTGSLSLESQAPSGFSIGSGFYSGSTQSTIEFKDANTTANYKVRIGCQTDDMLMFAGGSERMRIDSSGNVGIGTSSPDSKLDVSYGSSGEIARFTSPNATSSYITIGRDGSTTEGFTAGYNSSTGDCTLTAIAATHPIIFKQTTAERMRIDSSGNLLVGTTNTTPSASNVDGFSVAASGFISLTGSGTSAIDCNRTNDGTVQVFRRGGVFVGSVSVSATATAYNTSSDQRLKENITDADDAGSKIDAIQVRQYDWKADGSHQDYGMIAQELMTAAPEAVSGDPESDQMMGVDYSKLVPMLIKEVQSLRARVAQLETGV